MGTTACRPRWQSAWKGRVEHRTHVARSTSRRRFCPGQTAGNQRPALSATRRITMTETTDKPILPPGSSCTNCGKCCTNSDYMGSLEATGADVKRWRRQGRGDILRFAIVMGPSNNPHADLWVDNQTGEERRRCPFVRKVRNQNRYLCTIYETRPKVCRDYVPWAPHTICEIVTD